MMTAASAVSVVVLGVVPRLRDSLIIVAASTVAGTAIVLGHVALLWLATTGHLPPGPLWSW